MLKNLSPGNHILHYRLIRKIGEGGMGVVFEAEDARLGRTVAIKLLQPSISENPDARLRFLREARAASALDHPNLCTIYTVEELPDGSHLIVMACYRGQTVAELLLKSGAPDLASIRNIGRQTAAGLHAAHMAGIVHRDIKPGNIFLQNSGTVKILDFGLSHVADQNQLTAPHQVMGTLAYMPPEQLAGDSVDHRADIWALGAVLYEMAAGHPPFHHPTIAGTMSAITECRYIPLHQVRSDLPNSILMAVERSLRRERHERHSSAADLLRLLDDTSDSVNQVITAQFAPATPTFSSSTNRSTSLQNAVTAHPYNASANHTPQSNGFAPEPVHSQGLSIAVLPFRNVSPDPENEYFSDGLTDELISALGALSGIRVVSRTSVFSFKGTTQNIREIGQALDVAVILEGSVRRSGLRIRVTAQLTQIDNGFHLWSSRFDREMSDVFELQDELASAVVYALRDTLSLNLSRSDLAVKTPMQADAYEAYLKGRYHWNRRTPSDIQLAGRYFERAIKLDPQSAAGYSGMANFYCLQGMYGGMPALEAWSLARSSALKSIALDPAMPDGYIALASVMQFNDWDWDSANIHIVKAIQLHPQRGESYYIYVAYLMVQGLLEDALEQTQIGLTYDPLSTPLLAADALVRVYLGDYDTAILLAQAALHSAPHYVELYYALGIAQALAGRPQEAIKTFLIGIEQSHTPFLMGWLVEAHMLNGNPEKAREIFAQMMDLPSNGMALPIAIASASLGDNDLAFTWLEKAVAQRDILVAYIAILPSLRKLHDEPRFHSLLNQMNLHHPSTQRRRHVTR